MCVPLGEGRAGSPQNPLSYQESAMPGRIRVQVLAADPVSEAGVASQLRYRSELEIVPSAGSESQPDVVVVVADEVDEERLRAVRAVRRAGRSRVVLVAS